MSKITTKEAVQNAINELDFQSLITEQIKIQVESAVKDVISDQFRYNGNVKNQIEEEFEKIGKVDLTGLGIDGMSLLMSDAIVSATNELIAGETKEVVQKHLYGALDGYSKINNINKMVQQLSDELNVKEDYSDEDLAGSIKIEYIEESSSWGWVNKFWLIRLEDDNEDTIESIKFCTTDGRKGKVYSVSGKETDHLSTILEKLQMCDRFNLVAIVEEDEYCFNNYEC